MGRLSSASSSVAAFVVVGLEELAVVSFAGAAALVWLAILR